jgi:hypothetical protein
MMAPHLTTDGPHREGQGELAGMKPRTKVSQRSTKASARVTAAGQEAAAGSRQAKATIRGKAIGSGAVENAARRQFEKTRGKAIQAHMRAQGQRQQARRDSR